MSTKFSGCIMAAKVQLFTGEKASPNKNGDKPLILIPIAGKYPNKRVIDGTVAINMGITEGNSYLFQVGLGKEDPKHGIQFTFEPLDEVKGITSILEVQAALGNAEMLEL